ncbi:MAG TPA: replication-relaxation family protein, partial [Actinomycetota bacterium]|nr:replication-relaxation family protein [Actinomycetota bacterium]
MSAQQEQQAVTMGRLLDQRARELLLTLFEHRLLSTSQLKVLYFSSLRRCQDALKKLCDLALIARDRPFQQIGTGKPESLWTLTEAGVRIVAVTMRKARSQLDWMPRDSFHVSDRQLDHLLGVNRFFVSLVEASLAHPGHGLEKWVVAGQVKSQNNWVTHDGFGRYQHQGGACDFYFEYDRGTEWHDQLVRKLRGYVLMAIKWTQEGPAHFPNVLVLVPDEKREKAFDRAMKAAVESLEIRAKVAVALPMFITSEDRLTGDGMLGKIWRTFAPAPADRP